MAKKIVMTKDVRKWIIISIIVIIIIAFVLIGKNEGEEINKVENVDEVDEAKGIEIADTIHDDQSGFISKYFYFLNWEYPTSDNIYKFTNQNDKTFEYILEYYKQKYNKSILKELKQISKRLEPFRFFNVKLYKAVNNIIERYRNLGYTV